jgi:predicted MarR family transcription regulator
VSEYRISKLADFFAVPIELRETCFREVEYALALHELAYGDDAARTLAHVDWRDDGVQEIELLTVSGESVLKMTITSGEPVPYEVTPEGRKALEGK